MIIGDKYKITTEHFYIDLDKVISKNINTEAFLGNLDALVTEEEIKIISDNFINILIDKNIYKLNKGDIIEICYIEDEAYNSEVSYVEFLRNGNTDIEALSKLRLDCLEKL